MQLLFKQRIFSWFDSYDIYDEGGAVAYTVQGRLSWGHKLVIYDRYGEEVGMVREEIFTLLPRFIISLGGREIGRISKEFTFFKPQFHVDCLDWSVEGDFMHWDYTVYDGAREAAYITKQLFRLSDTYVLDIADAEDAIYVLMIALAIDAASCSERN